MASWENILVQGPTYHRTDLDKNYNAFHYLGKILHVYYFHIVYL